MMKGLGITTFVFLAIMTSNAHAAQVSLNLAPKSSKLITNHYAWTLNATCTINTHKKNRIVVSVLKNKGVVNGKNLSLGQATSMVVQDNDSITVSAEPGTEVTLKNVSVNSIQATCST